MGRIVAVVLCAVVLAGCDQATDTKTETKAPLALESPTPRPVQERWWEWAASEPDDTNPLTDRTGRQCARNQPGDAWFLAGTFGGQVHRTCTVPAGVELVAPAVNLFSADGGDCSTFMEDAAGTVELDGAQVPLQRIEHEAISVTGKPGNPVIDFGVKTVVDACGLWARIDPPGAGRHTVRIHGSSANFEVDVAYTLTVRATT